MSHRTNAPTPPMGWNSWDCFAAAVTEAQLLENAEYMSKHMLSYGWKYIICDIQWYEPLAGTGEGEYRPFADLCMDGYGRLLPAVNRFPSASNGRGFAPVAEKIHALGLKFGIHIMRGIPRQAVHSRLPVMGADCTADNIASPFSICKWNSDMYGIDHTQPGAQAYYDSIFDLYAQWGVDYVKVDDICNTNMYPDKPYSAKNEIEMIRRAIDKTGREMVLSLSPGPAVIEEGWHLAKHANLWRITDDFWDSWPLLRDMFRRCEIWQAHVGGGSWPDCDMLPLGRIGMGFRRERDTGFTYNEQITLMTLWSIFRSPLIMGGHLPANNEQTLKLLTNEEVIAVNQQGSKPCQLRFDGGEAVWFSKSPCGGMYVALFNLLDESKEISLAFNELNLINASVRDLWKKEDFGVHPKSLSRLIPPHGAELFLLNEVSI